MDVRLVRVFDSYCTVDSVSGALGLSGGPTLLEADFSFDDGSLLHPAVGYSPLRNVGGIDNPSLNLYGALTIWDSWPDGGGPYPIELGLNMQLRLVPEPSGAFVLLAGVAAVLRRRCAS